MTGDAISFLRSCPGDIYANGGCILTRGMRRFQLLANSFKFNSNPFQLGIQTLALTIMAVLFCLSVKSYISIVVNK